MRTVTAREANQTFSRLLADVEGGDTVAITKRGRKVAELRPAEIAREDHPARMKRWNEFMEVLRTGVDLEGDGPPYTRDEMHER
jgi:prevent-host-death family protein